jgi:hypothetical protein
MNGCVDYPSGAFDPLLGDVEGVVVRENRAERRTRRHEHTGVKSTQVNNIVEM